MKKITVYAMPGCEDSAKIKEFLKLNNLAFEEIMVNNEKLMDEVIKLSRQNKKSIIKIVKNHGIGIYIGFNGPAIKQLL